MPETGKDRSSRIEMDYYRQRSGLSLWKVRLAIIGFVAGSGILALALTDRRSSSPGLVFEGHASFEQDCEACHQPLTPIANDSVRSLELLGISQANSVEHTFAACTACHHGMENPIAGHHRGQMTAQGQLADKNCASCHSEHQGRHNDMTRVASKHCTACHSQLSNVCSASEFVQDMEIDAFATHGDFASLQKGDPGTVKFSHAQHLRPGQSNQGKDVIRLRDLEPEYRERYRRQMKALKEREPEFATLSTDDDALVQLDCQSCHAFDDRYSTAPIGADAMSPHFLPVNFESHCAACHQMNPPGRAENTLAIPHAAPWTEIDLWLATKGQRPPANDGTSPIGIGGSVTPSQVSDEDLAEREAANLQQMRQVVRQQCLKCHDASLVESDASIMKAKERDSATLIPSRWLIHGRYDHGAHASISCQYCHPQAYEDVGENSGQEQPNRDHETVMILGIETCKGCHRPAGTPTPSSLLAGEEPDPRLGMQSLWASDRCVTCHRYHNTVPGTQDQSNALSSIGQPTNRSVHPDSADGVVE